MEYLDEERDINDIKTTSQYTIIINKVSISDYYNLYSTIFPRQIQAFFEKFFPIFYIIYTFNKDYCSLSGKISGFKGK